MRTQGELRNIQAQIASFQRRIWVAMAVVLVCFGLLVARMVALQWVGHDDLQAQAERNSVSITPLPPARGEIVDRNGVVLATNETTFALEVTPSKIKNMDATLAELGQLVELSERDLKRFARAKDEVKRKGSAILRNQLSADEINRFAAHAHRFEGIRISARLLRTYPLQEVASHAIGYIGRINQREKTAMQDWDEDRLSNYRGTDYIGKLGVEQSMEEALHGVTGFDRVLTAASGKVVRTLSTQAPTAGQTMRLTLDIKLQHMVETLYGHRRGALVAIDPRDGAILAFVSKPTFNPNLFVEGIDQASWAALNESIDRPLLNRAIRGTYPPGSTYKPFMALAGLETGYLKPNSTLFDPGYYMFGDHKFRSHGDGLGMVDLRRSIAQSSNTYYFDLANRMGIQRIHDFMAPLGFGQPTGIDIGGETKGILPSPEWKRKTYKRADQQKWYAGETISIGIGQGYNSFTMTQLASALATLVNGGVRHTPHLVAREASSTGVPLGFNPEYVRVVKDAMVAVTTDGTSRRVFANAPYVSGGKTGTSQAVTIKQNEKYNAAKLEEHQRDHSLYVAFAPAEAPTIAVALIVENAGFGAEHAAPIARRVFDYWLLDRYPNPEDMSLAKQGRAPAPVGTPWVASELKIQDLVAQFPPGK